MLRKEAGGAYYDFNYHLAPSLEQASEAISRWTRSALRASPRDAWSRSHCRRRCAASMCLDVLIAYM